MFRFPADLALEYFELGFPVVPTKGKRPIVEGWQQYAEGQTKADVEKLFRFHTGNCAIILGTANKAGLYSAVIDVDRMALFNQWRDRVNTWTVGSYRGGHFHILSHTPIISFKSKDYEIRAEKQLITVPISRHQKGGVYLNLTDPSSVAIVDSTSTLDFLPVPLQFDRATIEAANISFTRKPLTQFARDVLLGRVDCEQYAARRTIQGVDTFDDSRSALDMALMNSLASCGLEFDECLEAFANSKHYGKWHAMRDRADKYAPLKHNAERHADDYLQRTYRKALESRETQAARHALRVADAIDIQISRTHWRGVGGLVDKATLRGVAHLVRKTRTLDLYIGRREMSELAQLAQQTATRSLRRHTSAGRIHCTGTPESITVQYNDGVTMRLRTPALYTVNEATYANEMAELTNLNETTPLAPRATNPLDYFGVFEQPTRGGLGRMARSVYEALAEPLTQAQLTVKTGHSIISIKRAIKLLQAHNLLQVVEASKVGREGASFVGCMANSDTFIPGKRGRKPGVGRMYLARQDIDFRELGRKLGTLTVGEQRKAQHERERLAFQDRLQGALVGTGGM